MTIDEIKDLKDRIYEIEGLLELAQLREDKIPELEPLIFGRIKALSGEKKEVADEVVPVDGVPAEEVAVDEAPVNSISELFDETEQAEDDGQLENAVAQEPLAAGGIKPELRGIKKPKHDKPAFCLNDRFRFKRELFGNSDAEFSAAMNMIAAMDSYDEADEYFIGELGWNIETPEVADFMEIIRTYFEA